MGCDNILILDALSLRFSRAWNLQAPGIFSNDRPCESTGIGVNGGVLATAGRTSMP